jgi:CspA family cold shock protein
LDWFRGDFAVAVGTIKSWNGAKGWGILAPGDRARTGGDVFVHVSELKKVGMREAGVGDAFAYEIVPQRDGKSAAVNLERVERVVCG